MCFQERDAPTVQDVTFLALHGLKQIYPIANSLLLFVFYRPLQDAYERLRDRILDFCFTVVYEDEDDEEEMVVVHN